MYPWPGFSKRATTKRFRRFGGRLDEARDDPIERSEPVSEPDVSRYMLRFFRFAGYLALFQIDPTKDRIVVRLCRKQQPGGQRGPNNP